MIRLAVAFSLCALAACRLHPVTPVATSPSLGQETHDIKALSDDEIQGYLSGAGLGYARAAELNGYPGPRHVLELADSLALTDAQRGRVEQSFRAMQGEARARGREYVAAEVAIDRAFARGEVNREVVRALTEDAARVESLIRAAHLDAHLDMMAVLTPEQVAAYNRLRGYSVGEAHEVHGGHRH